MASNKDSERNSKDEQPGGPSASSSAGATSGGEERDSQVTFQLDNGTTAVETTSNHTSKLHALIIGINDYPNLSKLKGAVADADAFAEFLQSDLKVPAQQIVNLRDNAATRQAIIDSIMQLWSNPHINYGDPILIYYAGHGGARRATEQWKNEKECSSEPILCIPTGQSLAAERAFNQKGDNITVIFDSCHSASGGPGQAKEIRRGQADIPWDIDSDIIDPKLGIVPPPKKDDKRHTNLPLCADQTSHVHLAACGSEEKAYEEDGRGVFTVALLKSIRAHGVDKLTYHNLVKSLPSFSRQVIQSPHCYGKHKDRVLFDSSVPSRKHILIPVKLDADSDDILLEAGAASGVTTKSVWEIYDSISAEVPLGRFQAEPPRVWTTVLRPTVADGDKLCREHMDKTVSGGDTGARAYARQVRTGVVDELRVYFTPAAKQRIFPPDESNQTTSYSVGSGLHDVGYVAHPAEDSADLVVDLNPEFDRVLFRLCDRHAESYKVATLEKWVRVERTAVEEVLFAAAKWKWHLQRKNTDSGDTTDLVTMEMVTMGERQGRERKVLVEDQRKSINEDGIVEFDVRKQDLYGIKLTSQVEQPLHIRMFYFDTTDFSISDMFGHAVGKDAMVGAKGTFTIGDNAKGGAPLQFTLNPDEKLDLGYMKVFWSTKPLEIHGIGQRPVFNRKSRQWSRLRGCGHDLDDDIEWGTAFLTLVQHSADAKN
ncbi:ICE-like protease (caspase) p20 domain protein [Rhizoctonia solani]|uniref:ICE-like protease (Caspase) p20 domain protein n=1 Tax=Rhizoctonia solani TaxID=456999 RepID=A0A8H8T2N5_9AGAM|nr:ICE-like protease (caspase) p20 domain protein [Rhizoctonia solani]QRW26007.1 ICE-like protease (caspase) p20 domain protein [Rhizoctonia solani]